MKSKNKITAKMLQSNIDYKGMALFFKIRDFLKPPMNKIKKSKVNQGDHVLDYGCGPGSYSFAVAEVVGEEGMVYAADIHPIAIEKVRKKVEKKNIANIATILTSCSTNLTDNSIDVVICFDVMHAIADRYELLKEFYRVLKPEGYLSLDDHHYSEDEIVEIVSNGNLFQLEEQVDKIFNFKKKESVNPHI
ncbi:MAG: class I SAM-dependent methyltransferase [Promethearchaeota archaeon]|nr:MAG: class I SAM-dependent methyltransferase [Candidatus Lokiarchaeota archaeon]